MEFERLTLQARPEDHTTIASKFRLQKLYDERALKRLEHLITRDPSRIDLNAGVSRIDTSVEATWSHAYSAELSAADPSYRQIEEEIASLRTGSEDSIRDALAVAEASPEYGKALAKLQEKMRAIDARLASRAA